MSDGDGCRRARVHIHIRETLMHSRCGAGNPAPTHQLPPLLPCSMRAEPPHQTPPALRAADGYDFAPRSHSMSACVRGWPLSLVPAPIRSSCSHLILTCAHPIHAHPHKSPPAVGSASALCPRPPPPPWGARRIAIFAGPKSKGRGGMPKTGRHHYWDSIIGSPLEPRPRASQALQL